MKIIKLFSIILFCSFSQNSHAVKVFVVNGTEYQNKNYIVYITNNSKNIEKIIYSNEGNSVDIEDGTYNISSVVYESVKHSHSFQENSVDLKNEDVILIDMKEGTMEHLTKISKVLKSTLPDYNILAKNWYDPELNLGN